ncbi:PadR family transcriptional regulator [Actinocorallia longicatena]|uniref:PadR family transcriptional regulator n=1 Tax=Actinocorallia longicatena TaxID=111803 RepID=A0ABP6Q0E8_9ACTN
MALRNAVMAALLEGEASGYDLAKAFDPPVANFWMATPQQLYRELDRMEAEGLVEARVVRQERRPDKRMFSLTDAGRLALHDFTARPARPGMMREELLVKVQSVDGGDVAAVMASVAERRAWGRTKLARYERARENILAGRSEEEFLSGTQRIGPYLTLLRGIAFEEENIRWADRVLTVLGRRTDPADP